MDRTYLAHEFAKRAGITVRALHHYDRMGLLKPSGRSAAGYRVYSDRDFAHLEQIVALKFIGFPLSQIRDLIRRKNVDFSDALRHQRDILAEKKNHLERAMRAIEDAERVISSGEKHDWEPFRKVIEVIQMQTRKDWMKKYYTEEQLADLRKRWSPEVQAESERGWKELVRDVEAAITSGADPAGEVGQQLVARRDRLIALFTGGDAGIERNLQRLYEDQANWPASFKKPYSEAVDRFLCEASRAAKVV